MGQGGQGGQVGQLAFTRGTASPACPPSFLIRGTGPVRDHMCPTSMGGAGQAGDAVGRTSPCCPTCLPVPLVHLRSASTVFE